MGVFGKQVTDEAWIKEALPLYVAAEPLISTLSRTIEGEPTQDQADALQDVLERLPIMVRAASELPTPKSAEAKSASKHLRVALKNCLDGAKAGQTMFNMLANERSRRAVQERGIAGRATVGQFVYFQSFFKDLTKDSAKHLQEAQTYFALHTGELDE